jgi:hypothetical protein
MMAPPSSAFGGGGGGGIIDAAVEARVARGASIGMVLPFKVVDKTPVGVSMSGRWRRVVPCAGAMTAYFSDFR